MAKQSQPTLTGEQVKARLEKQGVSITKWAQAHGFPKTAVIHVLNGFTKGTRGQARKIAIALGMRTPDPERDAA